MLDSQNLSKLKRIEWSKAVIRVINKSDEIAYAKQQREQIQLLKKDVERRR